MRSVTWISSTSVFLVFLSGSQCREILCQRCAPEHTIRAYDRVRHPKPYRPRAGTVPSHRSRHRLHAKARRRRLDSGRERQDGPVARPAVPQRGGRFRQAEAHSCGLSQRGGGSRHRSDCLRPVAARTGSTSARVPQRALPGGPQVRIQRQPRAYLGDEYSRPRDRRREVLAQPHRGLLHRKCLSVSPGIGRWIRGDRPARPGRRVRAILPGTRARL